MPCIRPCMGNYTNYGVLQFYLFSIGVGDREHPSPRTTPGGVLGADSSVSPAAALKGTQLALRVPH